MDADNGGNPTSERVLRNNLSEEVTLEQTFDEVWGLSKERTVKAEGIASAKALRWK